ncbi:MAG: GNVR domain-containing protein [Candidatus Omnitrophota bacterium]
MTRRNLQNISVDEYIYIYWKRKWLVIIPVFVAFILAIAACLVVKPEYRASSVVLVEMVKPGVGGAEGGRYETYQQGALYSEVDTFSKLFVSKPFLELLAVGLNIDLPKQNPVVAEERIQGLKSSLSIEPSITKGVLKVTAHTVDPIFCARLANTATELFIKYYREIGSERSSVEVEFLKEQKELYRKRLEQAEDKLRKFKEENQEILFLSKTRQAVGTSGADVTPGSPAKFEDYKTALFNLSFTLEDLERNKKDLEGQLVKESEEDGAAIDDPVLQEMFRAIADKSMELSKLKASGLTEEHPAIVKLKREIQATEIVIKDRPVSSKKSKDEKILSPKYQQLSREIVNINREIEAVKARMERLGKVAQTQEEFIKTIPEKEQVLARLQADYEVNAKIYTEMTSKLETASIGQRLEQQEKGVRFKIIEPASIPLYPYKPNKKMMVLFGTMLGLMAGIGLVSFAEVNDVSFINAEELGQAINVPVLGNIDLIYTAKEAERARWKHNIFLFSLVAMMLTISFALILRLFL